MSKSRKTMKARPSRTTSRNGKARSSAQSNTVSKERDASTKVEQVEKDNDVSWYANNPEMLRAAASLPFSQSIGTPVTIDGNSQLAWGKGYHNEAIPGLMVLRYVPVPAANEAMLNGANAPMNVAAAGIYSTIRSSNSGGKNYDPPNLMLYLLAMDSVYSFYSWMTRIYGSMRLYSQRNRYLPQLLAEAQGANFDDLMSKLAQFRYYINQFAVRASSMCVPAVMSYYQRHFWLSQNIFADDQTLKAQLYMFVPACFLTYGMRKSTTSTQELAAPSLGASFRIDQDTPLKTLDDIITFGNQLVTEVITDEDFNIMSGDILKAYGADKLFTLSPITEDYTVTPVYSEEVLTQIENAIILGEQRSPLWVEPSSANWIQNECAYNQIQEFVQTSSTNALGYLRSLFMPMSDVKSGATVKTMEPQRIPGIAGSRLLNLHKDDVDPADVMIATRLCPTLSVYTSGSGTSATTCARLGTSGSEYISNATIYRYVWNDAGERNLEKHRFASSMLSSEVPFALLSNMQHHPLVYIVDGAGLDAKTTGILGDMDNYTVVDPQTLSRIHETALLSQFGVPLLGQF